MQSFFPDLGKIDVLETQILKTSTLSNWLLNKLVGSLFPQTGDLEYMRVYIQFF